MKAKKWVVAKEFFGEPTTENLQLVDYEVPDDLVDGEILLQAVYLSVDPYMRLVPPKQGDDMIGEQLAEVIRSRNGQYPLGTLVLSKAGWKSHYVSDGEDLRPIRFDLGATPKSYTLGALGMPGATAYLGLEKCTPKRGELVLVSAASGAVGNLVGQLAKLKGCQVIGLVGSDEKVKWCQEELGFDHVINYKRVDFSDAIAQVAPEGVDIYFDNVGGDFYHTIVAKHMRKFGRVLVCGSIQTYNDRVAKLYHATNLAILFKELTVMGFTCYNHDDEWSQAFSTLKELIQEGKVKVKETIYQGIEKMLEAFEGLFSGENIGKSVVKAINERTNYP